jgi:uncharacterized protein YbbC (DUF1343 family)
MTYKESSSSVFPKRFFPILFGAAALIAAFAIAPRPAISSAAAQASAPTETGIDVLEQQNFAPLRGKHVGLITNQTGVDSQGRRTIDVLAHAEGLKLVALFSPEHGIEGKADAVVENATDVGTGLTIYSLFGKTQKPTDQMLQGIDALVFDIQGAGVRFYTYVTTMGYAMEAASKHNIPFFVLDRPDPLGGEKIVGPMLDRERISFVGYFPMPLMYAMTMGELAKMFNAENQTGTDLQVIAMKNWHRSQTYDQTGLKWLPPSPNLRTVNQAFLYPGVEILQPTGVSVGRGTPTPFEELGAPWIQSDALMRSLEPRNVPGVRFTATSFTPSNGLYSGNLCNGVKIEITDRNTFNPVRMGLEIADALHRQYPERFQIIKLADLLGSEAAVEDLIHYKSPAEIIESWDNDLKTFRTLRAKYLIYD